MGGMVLSQDKSKMVISDESGAVKVIDVNTSRIEKEYTKEHVDNIYKVAYANGVILTAGQDRRVGVYFTDSGNSYHLKSNFLVYCVGLTRCTYRCLLQRYRTRPAAFQSADKKQR